MPGHKAGSIRRNKLALACLLPSPEELAKQPVMLIVGGGPAAAHCAEGLRLEGWTGRVVMLCKENDMPYDRTKLSKSLGSTGADLALRNADHWKHIGVEVRPVTQTCMWSPPLCGAGEAWMSRHPA